MAWKALIVKKEFGGLGILNLEHMNWALLGKWYWKYYNSESKGMWKEILDAKYKSNNSSVLSKF